MMTSGRQEGAKEIIRFEEPTVVTMNIDLLFSGSVVAKSVRYLIYVYIYIYIHIYKIYICICNISFRRKFVCPPSD
jgi:hypothetical protein